MFPLRFKFFLVSFLFFLYFLGFRLDIASATFYGKITRGYQFVKFKASGYGIYVSESFISDRQENILIFAFGRTQNDLTLTKDQLEDYAAVWFDEAEKRGAVVVAPYWDASVVESGHHTEEFFLEILREVKLTYNIRTERVLLAGFALGAPYAFMLAAFYPNQFGAAASIAESPVREEVTSALMAERLTRGLPPGRLPPVLLVYGENTNLRHWLEEDRAFLEKRGNRVKIIAVPGMGYEQSPEAASEILDWFEEVTS